MAELRAAIVLATSRGRIRSARQLAAAAGISRSAVSPALRAVEAWGLGLTVSKSETPTVSDSETRAGETVSKSETPPVSESETPLSRTARGRARAQSQREEEREEISNLSSPLSSERSDIEHIQGHLASWMAKHGQGVQLEPPYPPEGLAHDLLTITGSAQRLLDILDQLRDERRKPGYSWGWFVTTVRSRILGHRRTRPAGARRDDRQPGLWSSPPEIDFASQSAPNAPSQAAPRGAVPRPPNPSAAGEPAQKHQPAAQPQPWGPVPGEKPASEFARQVLDYLNAQQRRK